jgi:hypothetical protein
MRTSSRIFQANLKIFPTINGVKIVKQASKLYVQNFMRLITMDNTKPIETPIVTQVFENLLEERKLKNDRRISPEVRLPASVERRSGKDRRASA